MNIKKVVSAVGASAALLAFAAQSVYAQDAGMLKIPAPTNYPAVNVGFLISAVLGILLIVSAIAALLFLILGGLQWITSGGDKQGLEAARNKITAAIVGLIIVAAAWAIMTLVGQFVGLDFLGANGLKIPTIKDPSGNGAPPPQRSV